MGRGKGKGGPKNYPTPPASTGNSRPQRRAPGTGHPLGQPVAANSMDKYHVAQVFVKALIAASVLLGCSGSSSVVLVEGSGGEESVSLAGKPSRAHAHASKGSDYVRPKKP